MLPIAALLVDFDGTACSSDVAELLLTVFGDPSWPEYDDAVDAGEIGLREAIQAQDALLRATGDELIAYAVEHCPLDPTFPSFVEWLTANDIPLALVSDGFGFYIGPILEAAGLGALTVFSNEQVWGADGRPASMRFVNGHEVCVGCGTCKMNAVLRYRQAHGPVGFIGDGQSDRYGAIYADMTFAKGELVDHCLRDGVPFVPWNDFDDVRRSLEATQAPPGSVAPISCPGWTIS
jgi:2-hydroxy-3-keto-5-methylthiopentenyl-1-phosphate phosphatase